MTRPLTILGVTHPVSWNNGACLLRDGEILAYVEEERFNRFKHSPRVAPVRSIEYCLETAGITPADVDHFAIGWDQASRWMPGVGFRRYQVNRHYLHQLPFDVKGKNVHFVNHHVAHALSSFLVSGFDAANVISLDASGGQESGLLGIGRESKLEVVHRVPNDSSWGILYGSVTGALGFRPHSDEGKVMGLAAYGTPDLDRIDFIDWDRDVPRIDRPRFKKFMERLRTRKHTEPLEAYHKDLAATLQATLEKAILQMARFLHEKSGLRAFCLGGGCALNCSANGRLQREAFVDDIFIQPAAHDVSSALGAALKAHVDLTGERPRAVMRHAYWGPEFTNGTIAKLLKEAKVARCERPADLSSAAADLLADGKILGWFQGRMEAGPRALGGRSILADPTRAEMKDVVNNQVKGREPWRPFAPSFLAEKFHPYVTKPYDSPFMILAFQGVNGKIDEIPAAMHVDKTVRVQTVEKETNPPYHDLITAFEKRRGVPAVLNTSFNVAGQPIVCTPFDALSTFFASGLDVLALGPYLVWK